MAWGKAGSTTLSSAGDDIDITSLSESKTRMIMSHVLNSGACQNKVTFNDTGSSKYACRIQYNDDPEDLRVNQNFIPHWDGNDNASNDQFVVSYLCDVEGEEKLGMYWSLDRGTAGAGNTIRAREMAYKFIDTPKITRFDLNNQGSGDYGADSNVTILGSEITPAAAVPAVPSLMKQLQSPSVGGWKEIGRTTLSGASDQITISSLPDKRYYMTLFNPLPSSTIDAYYRLNGDTGSNYANRYSQRGGSDGTQTNSSQLLLSGGNASQFWGVQYFSNLSGKEKLCIGHTFYGNGSSASTAPDRHETVGKWSNTSDAINSITAQNLSAGSYASGSEVVVLGYDPDDTHTDNFWEELASVELSSAGDNLGSGTFTAKKYLWIQVFLKASGTYNTRFRVNSDSGNNYAVRWNTNGGSDNPDTSQSAFYPIVDGATTNITTNSFMNIFIVNNESNEKLIMWHGSVQNTAGAGNAPARVEGVAKWANTSAQITDIDIDNTSTGDYDTGSIIKVWGAD